MNWKKLTQSRMHVNLLMTVLLFATMAYPLTFLKYHEWLAYAFIIVFGWHLYLNRNWLTGRRGKRPAQQFVHIINWTFIIVTAICVLSGMPYSHLIPHPPREFMRYAKYTHIISSTWFFVLVSAHIGLHASFVKRMWNKIPSLITQTISPTLILLIASAYGIYAAHERLFFLKMGGLYLKHAKRIGWIDMPLFLLDHLCIMIAVAYITHLIYTHLQKK